MKTYSTFSEYVPKERIGGIAIHLRNVEGEDWYDVLHEFSKETYKMSVNDDGQILGVETEADMLWPAGLSVVEVSPSDVPGDMEVNRHRGILYYFKDGKIVTRENPMVTDAKEKRATLLKVAANAITPLQDIVDVGEPTQPQLDRLKRLKQFRVAVTAVDATLAPNVVWPEFPL